MVTTASAATGLATAPAATAIGLARTAPATAIGLARTAPATAIGLATAAAAEKAAHHRYRVLYKKTSNLNGKFRTTFLNFYDAQDLHYNIIFVASAEEEISGSGGIEAVLPVLPPIDFAIVGEPTLMQMAVAEKGLMVLDCTAIGITGHAARNEGENALYKAINDINWLNSYKFEKVSPFLGPVKTTVTVIETDNKAHNVVPASCKFVVDVRVNELYTFEEVIAIVQEHFQSSILPRSFRLKSSSIAENHPLVMAGKFLGKTTYGSPTTSDKALMPFPALKMGPGNSARSHTADEFIYVNEIEDGIQDYIKIINQLVYKIKP
jgi:acetylornithine deacetylase